MTEPDAPAPERVLGPEHLGGLQPPAVDMETGNVLQTSDLVRIRIEVQKAVDLAVRLRVRRGAVAEMLDHLHDGRVILEPEPSQEVAGSVLSSPADVEEAAL